MVITAVPGGGDSDADGGKLVCTCVLVGSCPAAVNDGREVNGDGSKNCPSLNSAVVRAPSINRHKQPALFQFTFNQNTGMTLSLIHEQFFVTQKRQKYDGDKVFR